MFSGDTKESQRLGSTGAVRPFVGYGRQLLLAGLGEVRRWFGCTFWNEHRAREAVLPVRRTALVACASLAAGG